jgi:hypothetical protein
VDPNHRPLREQPGASPLHHARRPWHAWLGAAQRCRAAARAVTCC